MTVSEYSRWSDLIKPALLAPAALVVAGTWLTAADTLMTVTMMPTVAREIGGFAWLGWSSAAFYLGSILAGAVSGRLSARLGLRGGLILAGGTYAAGCAMGALSPDITLFTAARALQGVGGGWVMGLCYVAVTALFPERLWNRMLSALAGVWGVATLVGPLIGGLFAEAGLWRGGFVAFAVQGLVFCWAVALLVPKRAGPQEGSGPVPWRALGVLTLAVLALSAAGVMTAVGPAAALTVAGLGLIAAFLWVDRLPGGGLLPANAGRPRTAVGAGLLAVFAFCAATASLNIYGPLLMQSLHGASPTVAGYALVSEAGGWTLAALLVSGWTGRRAEASIRTGSLVLFAGLLMVSVVVAVGPLWLIAVAATVQGVGFGLMWSFLSSRMIGAADEGERASASGAVPTAQLIAGAVGAACSALIANGLGIDADPVGRRDMIPWLFWLFTPLALAGVWAAWRLADRRFTRET